MTTPTRYGCIYQPAGRAAEYAPWALNLYRGCDHGCVYCYAPSILRMDRSTFHAAAAPRKDILHKVEQAARLASGHVERVLLSFTSDPYQHLDAQTGITRQAIEILHRNGIQVTILTKGGARSMRDLDLLGPGDAYAITLAVREERRAEWEPHAAPIAERVLVLQEACRRGLETWVSFEPVIWPHDTYGLFVLVHEWITHCKVGPLNYVGRLPDRLKSQVPALTDADWRTFAEMFQHFCHRVNVECYLKQELRDRIAQAPPDDPKVMRL